MLFLRRSAEDTPELKGLLRQLQPGPLSRAARMLLSAAQKAPAASVVSPKHSRGEPGPSHPESAGEARDLLLYCADTVLTRWLPCCAGVALGLQVKGKRSSALDNNWKSVV